MISNLSTSPILSLITFLPLVGVLPLLFLGDDESGKKNARRIALYTTIFTFAISLLIWLNFEPCHGELSVRRGASMVRPVQITRWGVDGISMLFVILTTFLMPLCILASWESVQNRVKEIT